MKIGAAFAASLLVLLLSASVTLTAQAQGYYLRCGHDSDGNPDRYFNNYGGYDGGFNSGSGTDGYGVYPGYGVTPFSANYGDGWDGHSHWRQTTHFDYHPSEFDRHYVHYDYIPSHYDLHVDGHWDYHD